jgi:hypothetical protein
MKIKNISPHSISASVHALRQYTSIIAGCGMFGFLAGCASAPESHTVYAPPPPAPTRSVTTTTTTTTPDTMPATVAGTPANITVTSGTPAGTTTIVNEAPPALQTDVAVVQPGAGYVWITGYWTWRSNQYQWVAGHWELPPTPSSVWIAPTLEPRGNAYKFTEGYWN